MPGHSRAVLGNKLILSLFDIEEILYSRIREVNSRPIFRRGIFVWFEEMMFLCIHPTKAQIKSSHEAYHIVYYNHLLVVGEEFWGQLEGMSQNLDIFRLSFQSFLCVCWIICECYRWFLIHQNIHLNSSICNRFKHFI